MFGYFSQYKHCCDIKAKSIRLILAKTDNPGDLREITFIMVYLVNG